MNRVQGIEVQLGNGKQLFAGYVPTRKSPGVGIKSGGTLNILGWFMGEDEYEMFRSEMEAAFGDGRWVLSIPTAENALVLGKDD